MKNRIISLLMACLAIGFFSSKAQNTLYMVKDNEVVAKYNVSDVDYITTNLPAGVIDNLPDIPREPHAATLLLGGSNKVSIVDTSAMEESGCDYTPYIIRQWDARTMAATMGLKADDMDHIDDCKYVVTDDGPRILVTSSYGWTVVLDGDLNPIYYTSGTPNAHSAELINGRWLDVACSSGGDQLKVYDLTRNGLLKTNVDLSSAHGAVWLESTQRLYAIGGQTLNIYSLDYRERPSGEKDENYPLLVLEKSIQTPQAGLHDLTRVDDHTLCVSGRKSRLFDTDTETFTEIPLFDKATGLKSVNYNAGLNRVWYTDSTNPEGDYSWSTRTVHFSDDPFEGGDTFTFRTPDLNLYKVRPIKW